MSLAGGRVGTQNSKFKIQNSGEAGYTLAMFVMVIAVMAIMMAAAVEIASFQMQREKEAELIFRGQQYVEGIRLYRQKYGRFPMRMKELWEANPRVLRRKWIDPITGSEKWGLVFAGEGGQQVRGSGRRGPQPTATRTPVFERQREGGGEKIGPIIGVYSLSTDSSIKIYEGRNTYDQWKFVLMENQQGAGQSPGAGGGQGGNPWGDGTRPGGGGGVGGGGGGGSGQGPGRPPQWQTPPYPGGTRTPSQWPTPPSPRTTRTPY
jgi:type II secretory pathway pseudopilin PulG